MKTEVQPGENRESLGRRLVQHFLHAIDDMGQRLFDEHVTFGPDGVLHVLKVEAVGRGDNYGLGFPQHFFAIVRHRNIVRLRVAAGFFRRVKGKDIAAQSNQVGSMPHPNRAKAENRESHVSQHPLISPALSPTATTRSSRCLRNRLSS